MTPLHCPGCGRAATLDGPGHGMANDNEALRDWMPPEGFVKVQFGGAAGLMLLCTACCLPAHRGPAV